MLKWFSANTWAALATVWIAAFSRAAVPETEREVTADRLGSEPIRLTAKVDGSGIFTWWLPAGADAFVLPMSAGVLVESSNRPLIQWLRIGSPWSISELPLFGVRYGNRMVVVIVPWPHYAEMVFADRLGVRFSFPTGREDATPCDIVVCRREPDPLAPAFAFRSWRESAADTGAIPRPRSLSQKTADLPAARRLFGAPHIYLWGPALFSRHDVELDQWPTFAQRLRDAPPDSFPGRVAARLSAEHQSELAALAQAQRPQPYRVGEVAAAINTALADHEWAPGQPAGSPGDGAPWTSRTLADALPGLMHDSKSWGDGPSLSMLQELRSSGLDRAVLLLSDLYGRQSRPDVAAMAEQLGFLFGPYDSYHTVHDPNAAPDATWETAQFDSTAYLAGRILDADGSGNVGFKHTGFHFSPLAARPYVRSRVERLLRGSPSSAWFIDCDATAECFDDYNPRHSASRVDDIQARRERLRWLETDKRLVVGSEGGSALFADVIHFGHGVQTPYVGHLAAEFRDPNSPSFLGRSWPSDAPASSFKPARVPTGLMTPYFDVRTRLPLYRAAIGDEVVVSHHWSFDSLKFSDVQGQRELLELLYMAPPLYHLSRETWPRRRERILRHFIFWSPLHRQLAAAPLTRFEVLAPDRLLQRTSFRTEAGEVNVTVNFADLERKGYPPESATVEGAIDLRQKVYRATR
ncbi:MAG: glycoside hydrolase [Verrucomicrobiota bacterium]